MQIAIHLTHALVFGAMHKKILRGILRSPADYSFLSTVSLFLSDGSGGNVGGPSFLIRIAHNAFGLYCLENSLYFRVISSSTPLRYPNCHNSQGV
jgi:hypothetical protein